jgi:hypothetical protein
LNVGLTLEIAYYGLSSFHRNERKPFKTSHTCFLVLEGSIDNSTMTTVSSSVKLNIVEIF